MSSVCLGSWTRDLCNGHCRPNWPSSRGERGLELLLVALYALDVACFIHLGHNMFY